MHTKHLLPDISALIFLIIFCSLGFWQVQRGYEKKTLFYQIQSRIKMKPVTLNQADPQKIKNLAYYPATVSGVLDQQHSLLLDNIVKEHQVGYEVFTPMRLSIAQKDFLILIQRGWIAQGPTRQSLPKIPIIAIKKITIQGYLIPIPAPRWRLGQLHENTWPRRLSEIELPQLSKLFNTPILPIIFSLTKPVIEDTTIRHWGYAMQWFALALTVLIVYLLLKRKKHHAR
jgi:surfeit locus 1 family protein